MGRAARRCSTGPAAGAVASSFWKLVDSYGSGLRHGLHAAPRAQPHATEPSASAGSRGSPGDAQLLSGHSWQLTGGAASRPLVARPPPAGAAARKGQFQACCFAWLRPPPQAPKEQKSKEAKALAAANSSKGKKKVSKGWDWRE